MAVLFFVGGLSAGMIVLFEMGRRLREKRKTGDSSDGAVGFGAVDGAVFSLLGLLIAFTFSGAASRFEARRQLIVQEANAIGTAYLRLDTLPQGAQPELRQKFRDYVDSRIATYRKLADAESAMAEIKRTNALQGEIWSASLAAAKETGSPAVMTLTVSSLNEMIDITTTRFVALQTHPPLIIFGMLGLFALAGSFLAGFEMGRNKTRSLVHMLSFVLLVAGVVYVILDLEYPRFGLIRIDAADQVLVGVRQSMK